MRPAVAATSPELGETLKILLGRSNRFDECVWWGDALERFSRSLRGPPDLATSILAGESAVLALVPTGSDGDTGQKRQVRNRLPATTATAATSPPWESTPTGLRSEWRLDSDLRSITDMRWWLRAFLGQTCGLSAQEIDDLVLAACEAANNAVEHAQQPTEPFFNVDTEIDAGAVTIVIQDHGQWRHPPSSGERGRGLPMMRALADTTIAASINGTTVTIRRHPLRVREAVAPA